MSSNAPLTTSECSDIELRQKASSIRREYQPLRKVSQAAIVRFIENLDATKQSGDPRYSFQTKAFLGKVGGFSTPVLDSILDNLTGPCGGSMVHKIASEIGYEVNIPGARQYLTVRKIERAWERDVFFEDQARANAAFDYDPETGEYRLIYFPEDN